VADGSRTDVLKSGVALRRWCGRPMWQVMEGMVRVARRRWWVLWVWLILLCAGWGPPLLEGGGARRPWLLTPDGVRWLHQQRHPPAVPARAAVIYDLDAGQVLLSQAAHTPMAPASLTKMMTALVVREHLPLDAQVDVPPQALVGGSTMGLRGGEHLSVRTLLYGMLLPSGNDAATALAIAAAGDVQTFVRWMNDRAAKMGLENTHFVNPHGLDAAGQVSTAWDMARIGQAVLEDPVLAQIVATPQIVVDGFRLVNRNQLLYGREDVVGLKTGTTPSAGESLAAAFRSGSHLVIVVVMGSQDRYGDTLRLWNYYTDTYAWVLLRLPPGDMNRLIGPWGTRWFDIVAPVPTFLPRWEAGALQVWRDVEMPDGQDGVWLWPQRAGAARFYAGAATLGEVALRWVSR